MVQALAFAELIFGGILITSALTGESLGEILTKGITSQGKAKLHAANAGKESTGGGGSSSSLPPGGTSESSGFTFSNTLGSSTERAPSGKPSAPGLALFEDEKRKLESFLKRPLTKKENEELATLQKKHEVPALDQ